MITLGSIVRASLLSAALFASACEGQPLPPDKADYAGRWRGGGIDLVIAPEGRVNYAKVQGKSTTTIEGPLQGWQGDDFVVGVMTVKTMFRVSEPPHEVDGVWKMTVDGVELIRSDR